MMKTKQLIKEIRGIFKLPVKKYYIGGIRYYTPYFEPMGFSRTILRARKLKPLPKDVYENYQKRGYGWAKEKWSNLPMARRSKDWIVKIFSSHYWIQIGKPFAIVSSPLGWKDKYESPRHEWPPFFQIWFFNWQFCIHWTAPETGDGIQDHYWEQVLWYLYYADKDIKKAEETWPWIDRETKKSTWNSKYLIK